MSTDMKKATVEGCENASTPELEQAKNDEVRRLIGPLSGKLALYCSDASIARYLRARNWNVKKSVKMLKATLKWRLEFKPEDIHWNSKSIKGQIKYLVYCKENAILDLPQGQEQMVWLIDFHGFSVCVSNISIKVTKETAHVLQDHYPERLGVAILYDAPRIFEPFWTVAKPFLEPKTANKVIFVYSDDPNTTKIMHNLFDMQLVESAFGGKDDADFDITKYAERMREDGKKIPSFWKTEGFQSLTLSSSLTVPLSVQKSNSEVDSDELDVRVTKSSSPRNEAEDDDGTLSNGSLHEKNS